MALLGGRLGWWSSAGWLSHSSSRCMSLRRFICTWKNFRKRFWIAFRSFALHARRYRFQGMPRPQNRELETRITMPRHFGGARLERLLLLSLCTIVIWFSGCAVGPNYARPNVDAPTSYRGETDSQPAKSDPALGDEEWSKVFQDPELQNLIRAALQNNYDVRIAAARVQEARAPLGITS